MIRLPRFLLRLLLVLAVLVIWESAVRLFAIPAFILPAPSSIGLALWRGFASALYIDHLRITVAETLLGFVFGSILALVLGTLIALSRRVEYFLYPFIVMFQSMPKAAIRILWEAYPQSKATGKDEATALRDDVKVLEARIQNWKLEKGGVSKWGESSERNYAGYLEFLHKWGILKDKVAARDLITNDLIAEINDFDAAKITTEAKAYKVR